MKLVLLNLNLERLVTAASRSACVRRALLVQVQAAARSQLLVASVLLLAHLDQVT